MVEIIAILSLAFVICGILVFIYFSTKSEKEYLRKIQADLTNLPIELQKFYTQIAAKDTERTQKLIQDTFKQYLSHIERLERQVLPKPVTEKAVKAVMNRIGEVTDETLENEIENEKDKGVTLQNDEWTGLITADTKVQIEGEEEPTVVE